MTGHGRRSPCVLVFGNFVVPFFALLNRASGSADPGYLAAVGAWVLVMHYVDLYWLVLPATTRRRAAALARPRRAALRRRRLVRVDRAPLLQRAARCRCTIPASPRGSTTRRRMTDRLRRHRRRTSSRRRALLRVAAARSSSADRRRRFAASCAPCASARSRRAPSGADRQGRSRAERRSARLEQTPIWDARARRGPARARSAQSSSAGAGSTATPAWRTSRSTRHGPRRWRSRR